MGIPIISTILDFLTGKAGDIIDDLTTTQEEKDQAKLAMAQVALQSRAMMEDSLTRQLEAAERVLVAELNQDDNYTKRARPTVVYVGLAAIIFNYVLVPNIALLFGTVLVPVELPVGFWAAWGGITGTWALGRTREKVARIKDEDLDGNMLTKIFFG